jgi:Fanconi anemia group M protein
LSGPSQTVYHANGLNDSDENGSGSTQIDTIAAKEFVYPEATSEKTFRQYQKDISTTALFNNTLVVLPTGLGKTFIAAVVMYNYWQWFPTKKLVFMAPTKPLIHQQIEACHKIMGIPLHDLAELNGHMSPENRKVDKQLWACDKTTQSSS